MDIIILAGPRPNCASCGKPLKSWNPLIVDEECTPCIADRISDKLIENVKKQLADKGFGRSWQEKRVESERRKRLLKLVL